MAGNKMYAFIRLSLKKLIISSLLSAPITVAVYFLFLQPFNFISKRYIAAAILLWIVLAAGIFYLLRRIKQKIASMDQQLHWVTILFCIIMAFLFGYYLIIDIENIPYNLFTLPKHSLVIENASENENDVIELIYFHSGLREESLSKFNMDGSWKHTENSLIIQGTQKASLSYEGWLVKNPALSFQVQPNGGRVNIYWDGRLEQVSLSSSQPYQRHVTNTDTIEIPMINKLPILIAGVFAIAIALFTLLLLLTIIVNLLPRSFIIPVGFLISYLFFFFYPGFLKYTLVKQCFIDVPAGNPIGMDLNSILFSIKKVLFTPISQLTKYQPYPPFVYVFFTPLTFLDSSIAYGILTIVNFFCYFLITLLLPIRIGKKSSISPLLMLIFITGLFSNGFLFEVERGQFNLIAMSFCLLSIFIFHYYKKHRFWAYILFTISIQLKLYPAIFIFMFIEDWRDWKGNMIRFFSLGVANIGALFILGINRFSGFFKSLVGFSSNTMIHTVNHSIKSFTRYGFFQNPHSVQIVLLTIVVICFGLILYQAYRQKYAGINPYLLLACTLGALLIPTTSHDYALSYLTAIIAILFTDKKLLNMTADRIKPLFTHLLIFFSIAYSSTLFSYSNKPALLRNNFPALMVMLIILTIFSLATNLNSTIKKNNS